MALTKATYSMISGAVINILDYGASPDATGSTNRVAIQAAIDAAIASTTTRAVYIPRGKFEIDAGIVLASPIYIFGDGFDITNETGSVIETTQTTGVALEFNNAIGSFDDGFILEGFMIVGPATGSAIGFQVEGAVWPNSIFRNLCAKNMGSHGFYFDDCLSANVENCRAQGNGGNGYRVAESNAVRFRGCTSESNGSHGWEFINDGTSGERVAPSLAQCLSEENAGDAIRINQYTGIMISECYLQVASLSNVDYACIRIDNSNAIRVINNHITSNVAWPLFSGVKFVGGLFCEIIGTNFTGGFINGQDIVEDAASGRNIAFGNSGNGTQGMAGFTTASSTGSVYHSQMGSGSDYGQEWYAGYQRFKSIAGVTQFDATSAGVKVYSPAGAASYTYPLYLGDYSLWVDSTGDLRIKNGAPASDTDGTIVGTQS
jgi:hypothetical protein